MEFGIQKISIAKITKTAHVSQVTIYNYFESKQNLIHEVFIYYIDKASSDFDQVVYSNIPFPQKIEQLIFNKKEVAQQIHEQLYHYIMKEYSANGGNYIEKIYVEKTIPIFNYLFTEGKEQGFIDVNLSNEALLF